MDLIDADTLANPLNWSNVSARVYKIVLQNIKNCPKVKARPVVHAHWESDPVSSWQELCDDEITSHYKCSLCGRRVTCGVQEIPFYKYPYCNCGAKMDEEV